MIILLNKGPENFLKNWGNYYDVQGGFKANAHRTIPLEKLIALIQEIYETRWNMEEDLILEGKRDEIPNFIVL